jgi:hypothetical protein
MDSDENMADWKFFVYDEDFYYTDELNTDEDFNAYIEKFYLVHKRTGEVIEFAELGKRDMFLFSSVLSMLKKDKLNDESGKSFVLSKLTTEDAICAINIVNNELSTPLKNIIKLLDRKDHFNCNTIDDMVNKLVQLTIDSGMSVDAVHGSMLIKGLIRDANNILLAPDFSNPDLTDKDYTMLSVSNALIYNPSLSVSFAFDNANKQIINPLTYKKYKPSDYDIFFKEDIYDESLKYYRKKKQEKRKQKLAKLREEYKRKLSKK